MIQRSVITRVTVTQNPLTSNRNITMYLYFRTLFSTKRNVTLNDTAADVIKVTPSSSARIEQICTNNNTFIRIFVDSGGCKGFQYKFEIDTKVTADDVMCGPKNRIVIDPDSLQYCTGATLDYYEDIMRAGFRISSNPKADTGCSCGVSFAMKMD